MTESGWLYEWHPVPGVDASTFGPTPWGWFYEARKDGELLVEGTAPTRMGAFDAVAALGHAPREVAILNALATPPLAAVSDGT